MTTQFVIVNGHIETIPSTTMDLAKDLLSFVKEAQKISSEAFLNGKIDMRERCLFNLKCSENFLIKLISHHEISEFLGPLMSEEFINLDKYLEEKGGSKSVKLNCLLLKYSKTFNKINDLEW